MRTTPSTSRFGRTRTGHPGIVIALGTLALVTAFAGHAASEAPVSDQVLEFEMQLLDGRTQDLAEYRGKVVLLVNVASRCGLTPQYAGLQSLYERKKDQGFVVLGFPANDFAQQEPGTDEEIAKFCRMNYGVTFPVFSKIHVRGPDIHPLYDRLTSQPDPVGGPVAWNFQKYLVNREGRVVERFAPSKSPESTELVALIEKLLAESPGGAR
jgi:glutathione peroxidase